MKKVWKIISVVLAMVLLLSIGAFAEDAEESMANEPKVTISVGSAEVTQGTGTAEVSIPVTLDREVTAVSFQFRVDFDEKIKFTKLVNNSMVDEVMASPEGANPVTIAYVDFSLKGVEIQGGTLVTLVFEVPLDETGKYPISIAVETVEDSEVKEIGQQFLTSSGMITVEPPYITSEQRGEDAIALKIDNSAAYSLGKMTAIDSDNNKVVPYLKNDRTLVPLRFVSETLGAEVKWEDGWNYCYVVKGDKEIKITFNSADIEVNGEVITYDAPVEVVENRTMVPIRFISEELGYDVQWNQANQLVIITPADNAWNFERQAEKDLFEQILVTYLMGGVF